MTSTRPSNPGGTAWLVFALAVGICVAGFALAFSGPTGGPGIEKVGIEDAIDTVFFLTFPLVGALLVSRRGNPLGWVFLAVGLFFQLGVFMAEFSTRMLVEQGPSLGTRLTGLFAVATFFVPLGLAAIFLPLLFPNGRLASARLRPVVWVAAAALTANVLSIALLPGPLDEDRPAITNPIGIEAAGRVLGFLVGASAVLLAILAVVSVVSLIVRGFWTRGEERRQFMLLAAGVTVLIVVGLLDSTLQGMVPGWGPLSALIAISALPLATYLALVREAGAKRQPEPAG